MSNKNEFLDSESLVKTPLDICMKFAGLIDFSFFISIGEQKHIEIHHDKQNLPLVFQKYKDKGIKQIFVRKVDYEKFVKELRESLESKLNDPKYQVNQKMQALYEGFHLLRDHLLEFGFQKSGFNLANNIAKEAINNIKTSKELYSIFKRFREESSDKFIENTFVGYLVTMMISTFEWQTPNIKEKANIAVFLSDISLNEEDFNELEVFLKNPKRDFDLLGAKVKNHPVEIAKALLTKNLISKETALIIEQHHERPDETAFPKGVNYSQIGLLSAVHIVARHFMELVYENDFDESKKNHILQELKTIYDKKNFLLAFRALLKSLRMDNQL